MKEKIYFRPGELVTLKQDIPNKPIMMVVEKDTCTFKLYNKEAATFFRGIKCR